MPRQKKETKKPEKLYRGSPHEFKFFSPSMNKSKPGKDVPDFVYASCDEGYAWCFAFDWTSPGGVAFEHFLGSFSSIGKWRLVLDHEAYQRMANTEGYLYELDPLSFHQAKQYGTPDIEWVTDQTVTPMAIRRGNVLRQAVKCGVQVYVAAHEEVLAMRASTDHGAQLILDMDTAMRCVNSAVCPDTYVPLLEEVKNDGE